MYGTIARMRFRPGGMAEARTQLSDFGAENVPGFIASYIYRTDADPNEAYLVVLFENRETYVANAESPEQDARYRQLRALLEADPEWHDGEVVDVAASPMAAPALSQWMHTQSQQT